MEVLPDLSNDLLMWNMLVGFLLPNAVAVVNQPRWSPVAKGVMTLIAVVLAGGGTAWFNGAFTGRGILSSVLVVGVLALVTYQTLWKPSNIAPAIERGTSPDSSTSSTGSRSY
jgi:hypothetical protein